MDQHVGVDIGKKWKQMSTPDMVKMVTCNCGRIAFRDKIKFNFISYLNAAT